MCKSTICVDEWSEKPKLGLSMEPAVVFWTIRLSKEKKSSLSGWVISSGGDLFLTVHVPWYTVDEWTQEAQTELAYLLWISILCDRSPRVFVEVTGLVLFLSPHVSFIFRSISIIHHTSFSVQKVLYNDMLPFFFSINSLRFLFLHMIKLQYVNLMHN